MRQAFLFVSAVLLGGLWVGAQQPVVTSTGGSRIPVVTIGYEFDFAQEGPRCTTTGHVSCVDAIELVMMDLNGKYNVEKSFRPFPTGGTASTMHRGAWQLWGPPKGPPYRRAYWVVLVKRAGDGSRRIRVLATQGMASQPARPELKIR